MEFRQVNYFLAAAQTQNFRKAAEMCLVTQPALSRQIMALEKELGIQLFRRIQQHVELTPAGETFVAYAKEALEVLQEGEQKLTLWQQGLSGTVLIGCNHSLAAAFLPSLLATFRKDYPDIRLKAQIHNSDEIISLVERGMVDLGFIYDPALRSEMVTIKELFREPLHLFVATNHPLTQLDAQECTLERIVREPLLMLGETARLRKILERIFHQHGHAVQPVIEIESIEGLKELVRQGCGVTLMPETLFRSSHSSGGLTMLPIADVTETFMYALVYRRVGTLSIPARQFMNMVIETTSMPHQRRP